MNAVIMYRLNRILSKIMAQTFAHSVRVVVLISACMVGNATFADNSRLPVGTDSEEVVERLTDHTLAAVKPSVDFDARHVVQLQMEALRRNTTLGDQQGIEVAFRFASPTNRRATGPLLRFMRMLNGPTYSPMLDTKTYEVGDARVTENGLEATVPVVVTAMNDKRVGYLFQLSKDTGVVSKCQCWLTDSVARIDLPQDDSHSI